jgi:hypothetical protein
MDDDASLAGRQASTQGRVARESICTNVVLSTPIVTGAVKQPCLFRYRYGDIWEDGSCVVVDWREEESE